MSGEKIKGKYRGHSFLITHTAPRLLIRCDCGWKNTALLKGDHGLEVLDDIHRRLERHERAVLREHGL